MLTNDEAKDYFKYLIEEDNINELVSNNNELVSNNNCLITNERLEKNFIKLDCNHCFNYVAIYNEIVQQKLYKLQDNKKLKLNEIKCPYCRKITNKLIPYFKYYNIKQIKGVNSPKNLCMNLNYCQHINKKNEKCNENACITNSGIYCNKHLKLTKKDVINIDNIDIFFYNKYKKKTIKDIKEELRKCNLKVSGNKDILIERLYLKNSEFNNIT